MNRWRARLTPDGMTNRSSYDAIPNFGLLYDSVPAYAARRDVAFYVEEAARIESPILELGSGTGRILLPLARAGHTIVGLDGSANMLARCRAKLLHEPETVQRRVVLHEGDVRELELGQRFELVIAPFRVMQQLTTIEDQLRLLWAVQRHLTPSGRFIFDVFNPNFAAIAAADGAEREDTPEQPLPDGGSLRRTARISRVRWADQVSETELIYYVTPGDGAKAHRYVQSFEMRWYGIAEVRHLLARGGFEVLTVHGDFDRSPLTDRSPEQVVCATPHRG